MTKKRVRKPQSPPTSAGPENRISRAREGCESRLDFLFERALDGDGPAEEALETLANKLYSRLIRNRWEAANRSRQLDGTDGLSHARALAWECCVGMAKAIGTEELFLESQKWQGFEKARDFWFQAFEAWVKRQAPEVESAFAEHSDELAALNQQRAFFLWGLRNGRGQDPELYRENAEVIIHAAKTGDVAFFEALRPPRNRSLKNPPTLGFWVLMSWMPAALWAATWDAASEFVAKANPACRGGTIQNGLLVPALGEERLREPSWISGPRTDKVEALIALCKPAKLGLRKPQYTHIVGWRGYGIPKLKSE